eukprot:TRINITY_DN6396_c0_g1_i1.p2 TRINITY_DN6396_c0_g1~~TRINITY_DN6396_c0_g1_i1.p2  ORF type:complete len:152 (+),score=30.96 TRINITY_DN6396_c0_g1_i1:1133-1588(+)
MYCYLFVCCLLPILPSSFFHHFLDFLRPPNHLKPCQVVGVSEELDRFMTVTAAHLNVPVTDLVYKNEKVVLGKPKYEDLEPRLQTLLQQVTKDDETIYQHAKTVFIAQQQVVPRFGDKLKLFQSAQARIDQRCTFKETRSQVLTGLDCYRI